VCILTPPTAPKVGGGGPKFDLTGKRK